MAEAWLGIASSYVGAKSLLTGFGIHHRLDNFVYSKRPFFGDIETLKSQNSIPDQELD